MLFLLFMSKNKKAKIEGGPWNKDNADGPDGSVLTRLDQQSIRRRESLQPQQSHESLRPRPPNRRTIGSAIAGKCSRHTMSVLVIFPIKNGPPLQADDDVPTLNCLTRGVHPTAFSSSSIDLFSIRLPVAGPAALLATFRRTVLLA